MSIWIAGILFLIFGLLLRYHKWGRALYAIGGNADAARVAGIRVDRITWSVYIIGSILAALAGLMLTGRIASVVSSQGQNMIFYVFAASVIGGISLNGGRGRLLGALTGVLLLGFLQNVLTLAEVAAFWIDAVYGAIILVALILAPITGGNNGKTDVSRLFTRRRPPRARRPERGKQDIAGTPAMGSNSDPVRRSCHRRPRRSSEGQEPFPGSAVRVQPGGEGNEAVTSAVLAIPAREGVDLSAAGPSRKRLAAPAA